MSHTRILPALTLAVFICFSARADTIIFKTGTTLECKVVGDTPEGLLVILGNDDSASMVLDRSTIARIEYDYDSRLAEIRRHEKAQGRELHSEHYRLGVWCEDHGLEDESMYDRALDRYLYCKGKKGVPDEVYLRMGRMYEKCSTPNLVEAYNAYAEYLKHRPDAVEAEAAIKRLAPQITKQPTATPAVPDKIPAGEGLETATWSWERWSNPGTVRNVKDTGNKRTTVLEMKYRKGGKDKSAFVHRINGDISKKKALLLDIFNPGKHPLSIAVAIVTGGNYDWFESKAVTAGPGQWTLGTKGMRFDLTMKTWKSKATGWRNITRPKNLNATRNLVILIYNRGNQGLVYADNIRFEE